MSQRRPVFTPAEQAVLDVFQRLGDAARRGLHVSERVTARLVSAAHTSATTLGRIVRSRTRNEKLK